MEIIAELLARIIGLYQIILFIRIILGWFYPYPRNAVMEFIYQLTDPLLDSVRRAFPMLAQGGMDFSPILIFLLLEYTKRLLM